MLDQRVPNQPPNVVQIDEWKKAHPAKTDGQGPKGPPNWLVTLSKNTIFLCEDPSTILLKEFHIINKKGKAVLLFDNLSPLVDNYLWVNSDAFCNKFLLFEILEEGKDHE